MPELKNLRDEIWEALPSLEELIDTTGFKRVGHQLQGPHPVHGSTSGKNLVIDPGREVWYCFRCQSGGSKFEWIAVAEGFVDCSEASNISHVFPEVLKRAAEIAGIEFELTPERRRELKRYREEEEKIREVLEAAHRFFVSNLKDEHRFWIKEKYGFSTEVIERFGIGYSPEDGYKLSDYLTSKFGPDLALKSGLLIKTDKGVKDFFQGRIVIPYFKHGNPVYFIARKTPWTPEWDDAKYKKQLKHSDNHPYVSEIISEPLFGLDSIKGSEFVVITEGIADAISAIANGFPCLSPVTVRFKKKHIPEIQKWVRNKKVYVCNDNEESQAGLQGALDILEALHDDSYLIILPKPEDVEKIDLNDYFKTHSADDFKELMKRAISKDDAFAYFRGDVISLFKAALKENGIDPSMARASWNNKEQCYEYTSIDELLEGIRDLKKAIAVFRRSEKSDPRTPTAIEEKVKKRVISGVIRRDLERKGKFLKDKSNLGYYFYEQEKKVYKIQELEPLLSELYGVNLATDEGRFILKDLENYSLRFGEEIEIFRLFYYDREQNKLYIYDRDSHYYVLDGRTIKKLPNGINGIYFHSVNSTPIKYIPPSKRNVEIEIKGEIEEFKGKGSILHRLLVNRTNFSYDTALNEREQRLQLLLHIYAFPFQNLLEARPIMCLVGEKGSGKSVTLKMIGMFLEGPGFELSDLPDEKDFYVVASKSPIYFIDNIDRQHKWLQDALATISTGIIVRKRKLYSDFDEIRETPRCFLGLTSRDPKFKRDDVVDRMLIFHVKRFEEFLPPQALLKPIEKYQDILWSFYMDDLNKILAKLEDRDLSEITTTHRLADWAAFVKVVAEALEIDEDVDELLEKMEYERSAFTLQDDPLLPALKEFIRASNAGEWLTASQLHKMLCEIDDRYAASYSSAKSLAKRLANVESELKKLLGMERRKNSYKDVWEVRFPVQETEEVESVEAGLTNYLEGSGDLRENETFEEVYDFTNPDNKPTNSDPDQETLISEIKEAVKPAIEKYKKEQEPEGYPRTQIETNILSIILKKFPNANTERVRFYIKRLKERGEIIL
ncbi:MAG: toprim domain-containing protein [Archaeoglobus sp.]|nr:toprim domain-containing protein [Archaeoglobus sp.]